METGFFANLLFYIYWKLFKFLEAFITLHIHAKNVAHSIGKRKFSCINQNDRLTPGIRFAALRAARGSLRLGQSLRSFPRLRSPTFGLALLASPNVVYL